MKRIIRLTETDLTRIIRRIISEQDPKSSTISGTAAAEAETYFNKFKSDAETAAKTYITNNLRLPGLSTNDGSGPKYFTVKKVQVAAGMHNGIRLFVYFNLKNMKEDNDFALRYDIFNHKGKSGGVYGHDNLEKAKTSFYEGFRRDMVGNNLAQGGEDYNKLSNSIWSALESLTNLYNKNIGIIKDYNKKVLGTDS
jgi:hypothetical protein